MTHVIFGVSASSFILNMAIKQNAYDHANEYPLAAKVVHEWRFDRSRHHRRCTETTATVQDLFACGGFLLHNWNCIEPFVIEHLPPNLWDSSSSQDIPDHDQFTKTLGMQWYSSTDHLRLTVAKLPSGENITKRALISDVAKTYDVLGWFSPTMIKVKILFQQLWELNVGWDDTVLWEVSTLLNFYSTPCGGMALNGYKRINWVAVAEAIWQATG